LRLDTRQGRPVGLGLDEPDELAIDVQAIVRRSVVGLELADGDADTSGQIELVLALHLPAGCRKLAIDLLAGALFGSQVVVSHSYAGSAVGSDASGLAAARPPERKP
jgi:hypothetical protein